MTGAFSSFGGLGLLPDINESGLVAFYAGTDAGQEGFFVGDGTFTAPIVDSTPDASGNHWGGFSGFRCCGGPAEPALSGDGRVFFKAYAPVGGDGIHWGDGNVIQSLYQASNTGITEYGTAPSVNDFGIVAFLGFTYATDQTGYYAGDGGPLITVVENGNNFGVGGGVAINGLSHVVHGGFDGNLGAYVLRRWDGGPGEVTLADTLGQFEVIFYAYDAINDSDEVAFFAKLDNGEYGVWTTRDLATPVIKQGDPLFGSVVTSASPSRRSLNNRGQVAFRYELADGRVGVAVATPLIVGCSNGLDDDADGRTDSADFGCSSATDTSERSASYVCDDGIDNDGDALTDYPFDPGCAHARAKKENPYCNDGIDNDGDTLIDYPADTYCTSASASAETAPAPGSGGCGIGPELALALPLLAWARKRSRKRDDL